MKILLLEVVASCVRFMMESTFQFMDWVNSKWPKSLASERSLLVSY